MYARSTTFLGEADHLDSGTAHIHREVFPALETMPGFVGLSLLLDRESGRGILTTAWDSEDSMVASGDTVRPMRDRAAAVFGGPGPHSTPTVDEWHILAVHRDHRSGEGAWVRSTWLRLEPDRFNQALKFCTESVLPAVEEFEGFCSASVMADAGSRRAVISATYDSAEAVDRTREQARSLRTARLRELGADQLDVGEFELAIAKLRVPEMA